MGLLNSLMVEDIVWAVQEGIARSYSQLYSELRVYGPRRVTDAVNELFDTKVLGLGDDGFFILSANERKRTLHPKCGQPEHTPLDGEITPSKITDESFDKTALPYEIGTSPGLTPSKTEQNNSESKTIASLLESSDPKDLPLAHSSAKDIIREIKHQLLQVSKGAILASTPVSFLEFDDDTARYLSDLDVDNVQQLVRKLAGFEPGIGKEKFASIVLKLASLSGAPSVNLSTEDKKQLSILSGSNFFHFDLFGTLCTNLPSDVSREMILAAISNESFRAGADGTFSYEEYKKGFLDDSVMANLQLWENFTKRNYPVINPEFHVIMLPTVEEMVDEGAYESCRQLVHEFLMKFTQGDFVDNACFGKLRDDLLALAASDNEFGTQCELPVPGENGFMNAARRLADCTPHCSFDEDSLILRLTR